jgi:hypothetical protein
MICYLNEIEDETVVDSTVSVEATAKKGQARADIC